MITLSDLNFIETISLLWSINQKYLKSNKILIWVVKKNRKPKLKEAHTYIFEKELYNFISLFEEIILNLLILYHWYKYVF